MPFSKLTNFVTHYQIYFFNFVTQHVTHYICDMGIEEIRNLKSGLPKPKKTHYLNKVSKKKKESMALEREQRNGEKTELEKWYAKIMHKERAVCWESGERINKDSVGWHGSIAHILPKKTFPSVKTHPLNYLILSMWNGSHANFDYSWQKASSMKVWKRAVERFIMIEPSLTPAERSKLPDILLKHIKNPF